MNIAQIKSDSYKIFNRQAPENRDANIMMAQYIEKLAGTNGVNIQYWDIEKTFKDPEKTTSFHLLRNKNEVNRIFFATAEGFKKDVNAGNEEILKNVKGMIEKVSASRVKKQLEMLSQNQKKRIETATRMMTDAATELTHAYKYQMDMEKMSAGENTITDQIRAVLDTGYYDFHEFEGNNIRFVTRNDVFIHDKNPTAGVDYKVNFGQLLIQVSLETMGLTVLPFKNNNFSQRRYYHPHVDTGGRICWGNASASAASLQGTGELARLLALLASLLTTYSSESPHESLARFARSAS